MTALPLENTAIIPTGNLRFPVENHEFFPAGTPSGAPEECATPAGNPGGGREGFAGGRGMSGGARALFQRTGRMSGSVGEGCATLAGMPASAGEGFARAAGMSGGAQEGFATTGRGPTWRKEMSPIASGYPTWILKNSPTASGNRAWILDLRFPVATVCDRRNELSSTIGGRRPPLQFDRGGSRSPSAMMSFMNGKRARRARSTPEECSSVATVSGCRCRPGPRPGAVIATCGHVAYSVRRSQSAATAKG